MQSYLGFHLQSSSARADLKAEVPALRHEGGGPTAGRRLDDRGAVDGQNLQGRTTSLPEHMPFKQEGLTSPQPTSAKPPGYALAPLPSSPFSAEHAVKANLPVKDWVDPKILNPCDNSSPYTASNQSKYNSLESPRQSHSDSEMDGLKVIKKA